MASADPDHDVDRKPFTYRTLKLFSWPVLTALRVRSSGAEHIRAPGGFVLASNHASWLDPIVVGALTDRTLNFMGHQGLFENPFLGQLLRDQCRVIAVDREHGGNQAALKEGVVRLEQGHIVGIFPEGHRTRDGELLPFRTGVARLALAAGVPIVPVALNTFEVLPRHKAVPDVSSPVGVAIGEPMHFDAFHGMQQDRNVVPKVTEEVRVRTDELLREARLLAAEDA